MWRLLSYLKKTYTRHIHKTYKLQLMLSYIKHYACGETSQMRVDWMACYIAVSTALIAYTLYHTSIPASGVLHVLQVSEKRQMSILGWWPETVIFGPVFQVQPQIQMSCSQLHKRAERIGCMLMEKGRLNTGDHVALIYPPGQSHKLEPSFKTIQCEGFCNLLWRQIISSSDTMIWCFILSSLWKTIQCGGFCPS